jgi:hypothetical protein
MPNRGRRGAEPGTRELVVAGLPYIVVYRVKDDAVEILLRGTASMRRVNSSRAAFVPTTSLAGVVGPFASGVPSRNGGYAIGVPKSIHPGKKTVGRL